MSKREQDYGSIWPRATAAVDDGRCFLQLLKEMQQKFAWDVPEFSLEALGKRSLRVLVDNSETDHEE